MKEEVEQKVRHEVEAFKRRYLELRDTAKPNDHGAVLDIATEAVENSQNMRVRRLREWTAGTVTVGVLPPRGSQTSREGNQRFQGHLSPRRLLEDARIISSQHSALTSRSGSGMTDRVMETNRPPAASDAYMRMEKLTERLKGKLVGSTPRGTK